MASNTNLSIYQKMPDSLLAIKELGAAIAKSGWFKCENTSQGEVIALECLSRGTPVLAFLQEFHVMPGVGITRKYDWMLSRFNSMGGKHQILERSDDAAEIGLEYQGKTSRERLTWEEAAKEKWPYGKGGKLKDNWATPKARRQMLWARVVTEGLRALCPQATGGYYSPEEFDVIADDVGCADDVEDVSFTVEQSAAAPAKPQASTASTVNTASTPTASNGNSITREQLRRITDLYVELDVPMETREAALKKRGAASLMSLTTDQAGEILSKLEAKVAERQVAAEHEAKDLVGESQANPAATVAFDNSLCTSSQVNRIKELIAEVEQLQPGLTKRIKEFLVRNRLNKIAELCISDAERLIQHLGAKSLDGFFAQDLAKAQAINQAIAQETAETPSGN